LVIRHSNFVIKSMLALIYVALALYLGDLLCRRFYRFVSVPHRCAAAVLVGLLVSTWFTYLAALAFARTAKPLLWANLTFFAAAVSVILLLIRRSTHQVRRRAVFIEPRAPGSQVWDWVMLAMYFALACWIMFTTFGYKGGKLLISDLAWTDFGPHTALIRSFSVGHNFPTEYPFFSGAPIRYHFLFFFQAGNLEFLGLNIAWSLNILSAVTMVCMLALVMSLGQLLFNSRTVGRIGSALFFFSGSLASISFLRSQSSVTQAFRAVLHLRGFLRSGYPYRGEDWGIWTQSVYINQRHFASGIGILLIVLIFLIDRYQQRAFPDTGKISTPIDGNLAVPEVTDGAALIKSEPRQGSGVIAFAKDAIVSGNSFIFTGLLLGVLPLWNALVFTAAFAILLFLLVLFPQRKYMLMLGFAAAVIALPQVWYLSSGGGPRNYSLFQWGYTIQDPTIAKVVEYLGYTFGLKWPVIILALLVVSWFQRRFFIAICSLMLLAFSFRFSVETPANHKFLNIWLILANLFAAYGVWWLWKLKSAPILGPVLATALTACIVVGGAIDLFPIYNRHLAEFAYENDPLMKWVMSETKADKAFLTDKLMYHPILYAGRKLFCGYTLFAWGAGYDIAKRELIHREMFESRDPRKVYRLLKENNIGYVAFDNGVRHSQFIKRPNEQVYAEYFPKVFEDKQGRYNSLTIYEVPDTTPQKLSSLPEGITNMFEGGKGTGKGQFDEPLGIAVDGTGNVLVADSRNARIEKFAPSGAFITSIGTKGTGYGQFKEPNGIAIDGEGNIYVADAGNHRVQKLGPDGSVVAQWSDPGFYAPRDIAVGSDDSIYVLDQGHSRIVKMDPDGNVLAIWGSEGAGDGQFANHTGLAVDPKTNRVYVADPLHKRIQVFDSNGKFLWKWIVPEWQNNIWPFQHLVIDPKRDRLYASSVPTQSVLAFNLNGTRMGALRAMPPDNLDGPSGMALWNDKLYVVSTFSDRVSQIDPGGSSKR
jgi:DNA-binding beta-propeller fold protein YncE